MRCLSDDALKLLSAGWTVVASSHLLAATASRQFRVAQLNRRLGSWDRPAILNAQAWLTDLWKERRYRDASTPTLLSNAQELLLWQQVIELEGLRLLDLAATARAARRATLSLAQYEVPPKDGRWQTHHDAERFSSWLAEVQRRCTAENWITIAGLWRRAPDWLRATRREDVRLLLAGFKPPFPAMRRAIEALEEGGGTVKLAEPPKAHAVVQSRFFESFDQEWEEAARWARHWVEKGAQSLGVIVPGLAERRKQVIRVFDDVFSPSHVLSVLRQPDEPQSLIYIGGADPLRDHPVIAAALLVLDLAADRIPISHASAFLRSPFIAGAKEERYLRAAADLELRKYRDLEVGLRALERSAKNAPVALKLCYGIGRFVSTRPDSAEFPHWARFIAELLKLAGWPGDAELRSSEQQVFDEWQKALGTLASLGLVAGPVPWGVVLAQLRGLLTTEQPRATDSSSPVQIFDPQEAAGIQFDHLWITGLSHENWQFQIDSSPFIPRSLQAEFAIPGASASSQRMQEALAQKALLQAAPDVVASYSGTPLPILAGGDQPSSLPRWDSPLFKSAYLIKDCVTSIVDTQAPAPKATHLGGGTSLIKDQSSCPFRAFAKVRLEAGGPEDGTLGFDSRERGSFLHRVFEAVWIRLESQDRLKQTPPEELEAIVDTAIATALSRRTSDSEFHRELTEAERLRLKAVTLEWLEVDKRRTQPFRVVQIEEERSFDLNGVNIRLRMDRVDRLESGKLLLIDYKGGKQDVRSLKGDRPKEPQLLVYAASLGREVDGVLFAQVKPRSVELIGVTREQHLDTNKVEVLGSAWEAQCSDWRETVVHLAEEFRGGFAAVSPSPTACEFCEFKPLCRIREARSNEGGDEA
jgi:ATP-dependent helicase/nuclease subunit B